MFLLSKFDCRRLCITGDSKIHVKVKWLHNNDVSSNWGVPSNGLLYSTPNLMTVASPFLEIWRFFKITWPLNNNVTSNWEGVYNGFFSKSCTCCQIVMTVAHPNMEILLNLKISFNQLNSNSAGLRVRPTKIFTCQK